MPRYVILYHEMPPDQTRASHYDLMLESGKLLRTWAVSAPPNSAGTVAAELLNDHRHEFLAFEGEITGGRGSVTRWDEGEYTTKSESNDSVAFVMNGNHLKGELKLQRDSGNTSRWNMHFVPAQ